MTEQPPSGQPRNPLRAALERFGRERGQPQPQSSAAWPSDTTAASPDEVERRRRTNSTATEQGQPQQEPSCTECGKPVYWHDDQQTWSVSGIVKHKHWPSCPVQERQAGGHQRGELYENYRNLEQTIYRCSCARGWHDADFWQGFDAGYEKAMLDAIASHPKKKGVADAAAQQ